MDLPDGLVAEAEKLVTDFDDLLADDVNTMNIFGAWCVRAAQVLRAVAGDPTARNNWE
jgi:hypothetical protein